MIDHTGFQIDPRENRGLDAPDRWGDDLDPPYSRRLRHGAMSIASKATAAMIVLGALGGFGWTVYVVLEAMGVVE